MIGQYHWIAYCEMLHSDVVYSILLDLETNIPGHQVPVIRPLMLCNYWGSITLQSGDLIEILAITIKDNILFNIPGQPWTYLEHLDLIKPSLDRKELFAALLKLR